MTVDTKLPPEFHPLADLSGRRSYRLVHRMPGEDPGLDRVIMESLNTAQRRAFLIEFVGELRSDGATFLDLLAEMARELGFAVIHPHRLGRVVEPLSLLEQILEEFTTWEELGESLPEEMRGELDLISGEYSDPTGPVSRSPAGMRWARVDYTIELLERVVKRPVAVFVDNVELGGDLETLAILERLMCERSRLSFLVVLANVGDALFPDFFEKVDSLYIRYVPEIGLDDLGLLGEELAQRLTRNRLEQYLSEIPKSRVYVEQLKAYYELELGGGFEDQLLIPKTPIQLFMYRWDRLDAERRRLLLALACQMRPQSVERLARISGFDERKVALLLDDLLERFFCERRDSSFTLGAPHFFDWIRDFADREEIGEIHRACLREGVEGTRGLARDIFRIEHLCALERFDEALAELVTVLRNLHGRGFFPTICSLGCYVEKIAPKGADRRNLLEAQLILAEADGELLRFEEALRLLDSVKDSLQEDDARWAGRELLLRGNIHEATDDSEAAVGCFQAASRRFGKTVEGARALWRAIKTQEAL
ncbi:hypothetical protein KAU45_09130, partial [bacterium]|nr:hypothetical protein [bacterium]